MYFRPNFWDLRVLLEDDSYVASQDSTIDGGSYTPPDQALVNATLMGVYSAPAQSAVVLTLDSNSDDYPGRHGRAVFEFGLAYTPPTSPILLTLSLGGGSETYLLAQGFYAFEAGWAETVKWPQHITPDGIGPGATLGTIEDIFESRSVSLEFSTAYTPPGGGAVDFAFLGPATDGSIEPLGFSDSDFGSPSVEGTPEIRPTGISPPAISTDHAVRLARRLLEPSGISQSSFGTHQVANAIRYVDLAGRSIVGDYGAATVQLRTREVFPSYIPPGIVGSHMVDVHHDVLPEGFDAALYGTAYVHDLTQWVFHHSGITTAFGDAWVSRSPRTLEPVGFPTTVEEFPSTRWGRPTVHNLKQVVYQTFAPGTEDGGVFGSYIHMTVENRNRPMTPLGWSSSRVSNLAFVENNADPVYPPTLGAETCGVAMVAQAIRYVTTEGWEEFYAHPLGTALHNAAHAIYTTGWDSQEFGLAAHSNPLQNIRFVGGIDESAFGTAFAADAIRYLTVPMGIDGFPIPDPLVQNFIRYLEPASMELPFQFGSPFVEERFTIFYPTGFYTYRAGDNHYVFNVNREVAPYAYDQAEFGLHTVDLYTRYLVPDGIGENAIPRPRIADSRQFIDTNGNDQLRVGPGTIVTKIPPDPPAAQTIYTAGFQWSVYGSAEVRRNQIDCSGFVATSWGAAEVRYQGAFVSSLNTDYPMFGTTWVRGPQRVYVTSENVEGMEPPTFAKQRINPHTIWATFDVTQQAVTNNGGQWELVDDHLDLLDTGLRPFFGNPAVTNYYRGITASGSEFGGIGQPSVDSTIRYIRPDGIRSMRVGIPRVPGLQEIDFLVGTNMNGEEFGEHVVELQDREISVQSLDMPGEGTLEGQYGTAYVDFFHRYRAPEGWDSVLWGQPSPQDNRNSPGLRVHFFEPMIPQGYVATSWGDTFVSHRIRNVYPEPWVAFDNTSTPGMFRERMRVRHGRRILSPSGIASTAAFGGATIWAHTRHLYTDSIWRGNMVPMPDIRYQAIIALGGYGFDASVFGDVQRWEAGKIKPQGEEYTTWGNVRTHRVMYASGVVPAGFGDLVIGPGANPSGWDSSAFGDLVMVYGDGDEFLCGRKPRALVLGDISDGAFGTPSAQILLVARPSGWDSNEYGVARLDMNIVGQGFDSVVIGDGSVGMSIAVTGFDGLLLGSHQLSMAVYPQTFDAALYGSSLVSSVVSPAGVASDLYGAAYLSRTLPADGFDASLYGDARLDRTVMPSGWEQIAIGTAATGHLIGASGWDSLDMRAFYASEDFFAEDYQDPNYAVIVSHA